MQLIDNWRSAILRLHSMRAAILNAALWSAVRAVMIRPYLKGRFSGSIRRTDREISRLLPGIFPILRPGELLRHKQTDRRQFELTAVLTCNTIGDIMQQAIRTVSQLFRNYQTASLEKQRIYACAEEAVNANFEASEAACDAAYDALEAIADAILRSPAGSVADLAIKAQVLLARGAEPAHVLYYRPDDLVSFVQEVRSFSGR